MKSNTDIARTAFRYCGGIAALFILFSGNLSAQQSKAEEKPVMQVTYQHEEANYIVFKVNITNTGSKKAILKISGNNHDLLYSESFTGDAFIKALKVPKYENIDAIEFRLSNGKEVVKKSFEIKVKTKEVLEVTEAGQ